MMKSQELTKMRAHEINKIIQRKEEIKRRMVMVIGKLSSPKKLRFSVMKVESQHKKKVLSQESWFLPKGKAIMEEG